ncbi:MAG: hypothetical protein ACKVU4_14370 [Phycisphaerales bacterium]
MDGRFLIVLTACLWAAISARAQPGEVTRLLITVQDNGNANGIIEPGEAALIRVIADMGDDGINSTGMLAVWNTLGGSGQVGPLYAFSHAFFDLNSTLNGHTGGWSGLSIPVLKNVANSAGMAQANGSVAGIVAGQFCFLPTFPGNTLDPITLWSGTWTPSAYDPRTVEFSFALSATAPVPQAVYLLAGGPQMHAVQDVWDVVSTPISFQVIPAPATLILPAAIGAIGLARARRIREA